MNSHGVRQNKKPLPPWVLEKGPFIVLGFFAAVYLLFIKASSQPSAPPPVKYAKLIAIQPVSKTWMEGSDTRIKSIEVKVKNQGDLDALNVVVQAVVRGQSFKMKGKAALAIGETASFLGEPVSSLHVSDSIDFKFECVTCPPAVPSGN